MSMYWEVFLAFFIPGIVGYGGGPATIPLIEHEVVTRYGWMSIEEFGELLAIGNALPGPIATKMAGIIGYEVAGIAGSIIALFATVAPSLMVMIFLLKVIEKYKDSPKVKKVSAIVKPSVFVLMALLAGQFVENAYASIGWQHASFLLAGSFVLLERVKMHPAFVIGLSLLYGALFLR
ncbi:chromate transporter [Salipaludibacillus aurantiacus]|uniref:Chromate transporter n=1 Tax=Salipaludibacillus aurantiacus TaxID=1601833 RepID=A0A1H9W2B1_9BACI|nr:chromate transporter [Salipaludibacillus aurantiacus]SES27988.1 chromate transporter [Salipaludibacillus aurantiacus]